MRWVLEELKPLRGHCMCAEHMGVPWDLYRSHSSSWARSFPLTLHLRIPSLKTVTLKVTQYRPEKLGREALYCLTFLEDCLIHEILNSLVDLSVFLLFFFMSYLLAATPSFSLRNNTLSSHTVLVRVEVSGVGTSTTTTSDFWSQLPNWGTLSKLDFPTEGHMTQEGSINVFGKYWYRC